MSRHIVLVDEEMAVDGVMGFGFPGMEAVPLDGSQGIVAVDDPRHLVDYGLGGFIQVPAVLVPEAPSGSATACT